MTRPKPPSWPSTVAVVLSFVILITLMAGAVYVGLWIVVQLTVLTRDH